MAEDFINQAYVTEASTRVTNLGGVSLAVNDVAWKSMSGCRGPTAHY